MRLPYSVQYKASASLLNKCVRKWRRKTIVNNFSIPHPHPPPSVLSPFTFFFFPSFFALVIQFFFRITYAAAAAAEREKAVGSLSR